MDYTKGNIKSLIVSVVQHLPTYYRLQSLGEYNALLSLFNITADEVKGELHGIQKPAKALLKNIIEVALHTATDEIGFKK